MAILVNIKHQNYANFLNAMFVNPLKKYLSFSLSKKKCFKNKDLNIQLID
jgi:hypothetical protein